MEKEFVLNKSILINAEPSKVWEALTNPELIKQYFFGTECISEWKKGSKILFKGTWEGKPYEDKGNILNIENEKLIHYNYWSSFSGTEDLPENYSEIKYELVVEGNGTIFTVKQGGFKTQEAHDHSQKNWGLIMDGLKKLIET
jgi:uncharacterized protein YndB with AHSA1/START domain